MNCKYNTSVTEEVFQIDSGQMALSVNEKTAERASNNHSAAWENQFETLFEINM